MRCQHCNEKIAEHDLWCVKCGKRNNILINKLSSIKSINGSWKKYQEFRGRNLPAGIFAVLTGIIPLFVLIWILNFVLSNMPLIQYNILHGVIWIVFLPVLFIPFNAVCKTSSYHIEIKTIIRSFRTYLRYLTFSLISVVFYTVIFILCQGDPILNLVWIVLVLYWVPLAIPIPILMERYNINAWMSLMVSYKHMSDLRWNIFLLCIILLFANLISIAIFIVPLAIILPFSWFAIRDYIDKLIENEIVSMS